MARKALRTKEEIEKIPLDQPVLIETAPPEPPAETVEVEKVEPEPKVETKPEVDVVEDDVPTLKKQLEELKKNEAAAKTMAEETGRRLAEIEQQRQASDIAAKRYQGEAEQAQYDAISNALSAAQAEAEAATRDLEQAETNLDAKAKAESYRRLARAEANISRLEDGKTAFETRREEIAKAPPQVERPVDQFEARIERLPDRAKSWLREHREFVQDDRKNRRLQVAHDDVIEEGKEMFSPAYYEALETRLGLRAAPQQQQTEQEQEIRQERNTIVSAPPTREVQSLSNGKPVSTRITLSPEQREIARSLKLDEAEYARQVIKYQEQKRNGQIQ